jgi:predicted ATPase
MNRVRERAAGRSPFGELLRRFRVAAGLSQATLAERALLGVDSISALERGVSRAPQRETLELLIRALELSDEERVEFERSIERPSRPRLSHRRRLVKTNLPASCTKLFGRDREISEIEALLDRPGLVTLTGPGGVGKTQLAIKTGAILLDRFPHGVWFVDLAPLSDACSVAVAFAAAFSVTESLGQPLIDRLVEAVRDKTMLVIVDNCEHVLTQVALHIDAIGRAGPDLRIIATSRQSLGIAGEQVYAVASLEIPDAVALFEERARSAMPAFDLTDENEAIVASICQRLDGIPFAIELAAARLRVLSLQQLNDRLHERFQLLTGGDRLSLPRHQTMRALIDWSYDLLDAEEQLLFARLGVFAASFSLDAATAVGSCDGIDEWRIIDLLTSLVDKSLVASEVRNAARRYYLLETMKAYAASQAGDEWPCVKRRHAEYYAALAERSQAMFGTTDSTAQWAAELDLELEDFRAALDWAFGDDGDLVAGVRLVVGMRMYALQRGLTVETARRAEAALARGASLPKDLEAGLWLTLSGMRGDLFVPVLAIEASTKARELYAALGDQLGVARALRGEGIGRLQLRELRQAELDLQRSLALSREFGGRRDISRALASVAVSLHVNGRLEEARQALSDVVDMAQDGDDRLLWLSSVNLAEVEFEVGETIDAVARSYENLDSDMLRSNVRLRSNQESNLTAYLLALEQDDEARAMAAATIRDARDGGDTGAVAIGLQHAAAILAQKNVERAAELFGFVESSLAPTGYHREYTERFTYDLLLRRLRAKLSQAQIETLMSQGASMTEEQAIQLARRKSGAVGLRRRGI